MNIQQLVPLYENIILEYNEDFYRKQIARLKPQAGPYVTPEQIRAKISRFKDLKSSFRTKGQIEQKVKDAIAQGRKPAGQQAGAVIAPVIKGIDPEDLEVIKNTDPKDLDPQGARLYKAYQAEEQRISQLEKVPLEIRNYTWNDLEAIVDQFPDPAERQALKTASSAGSTGAKLIYNKNGLEVYFGADGNECYLLKVHVAKQMKVDPSTYNWCIAANPAGASNYHSRYRFGQYGASTPKSSYLVYDTTKEVGDKWHFMVIHVAQKPQRATRGEGQTPFMVTSARNDGDPFLTWDEILQVQPKLEGLESLFQFVPLSEDEQIQQALAGDANANTFKNYTSYKVKRAYIKMGPDKKIYKEDYLKLDPVLQHTYINVRTPVAEDPNLVHMLQKLLVLFQDSDSKTDMADRLAAAKKLSQEKAPGYIEAIRNVLTNDPTIAASKQEQTYKRWRQLVLDTAKGVGAADKARKQRQGQI